MTKVDEHIKTAQNMLNWIVERCYELEEENKKLKEERDELKERYDNLIRANKKQSEHIDELEEENKKLKEELNERRNGNMDFLERLQNDKYF